MHIDLNIHHPPDTVRIGDGLLCNVQLCCFTLRGASVLQAASAAPSNADVSKRAFACGFFAREWQQPIKHAAELFVDRCLRPFHPLAVRSTPESVEEVAKNGTQYEIENQPEMKTPRGTKVQHVGTECHYRLRLYHWLRSVQTKFECFALPVFGAGVACPQAVHELRRWLRQHSPISPWCGLT